MSVMLTGLKHFHFFVFVTVISGQIISHLEPTRHDLIQYLLHVDRYDPSLPPDFYTENITTVSVELSIYDLNSESDIDMEYECTLYLRMNWTDERLNFTANKTTFDSMDLGDTVVHKLWIPDLYFHHERTSQMHGLFTKNQLVYIYKNGSVLYSSRFNIKSHCQMDLKHYPFDSQKCPIVIQSYSLNASNLILKWNDGDAVRIGNGINLENIIKSQKHSYDSPYDNPVIVPVLYRNVGNFSTLQAELKLTRPKQSYAIMYVAPPVIFVIVSLTSFLLDDNIVPRFTVPTGALTQLIMQWSLIYNKLPATSEISCFDIWMLVNTSTVGLVLIINALMCHFHILKKKDKEKTEKETKEAKDSNTKVSDGKKHPNNDTSEINIGEVSKASRSIKETPSEQMNILKQNITDSEENEKEPFIKIAGGQSQYRMNEIGRRSHTSMTIEEQSTKSGVMPPLSLDEKELKEDFFELLEDKKDITTSTEWALAETIVKDDPRYQRVCQQDKTDTSEKGPQWYKEYIDKKKKKDFFSLLDEKACTVKKWERALAKIDHDPRYNIVDETKRKEWFDEKRKYTFGWVKDSMCNWRCGNHLVLLLLFVPYVIFVFTFYFCTWIQSSKYCLGSD